MVSKFKSERYYLTSELAPVGRENTKSILFVKLEQNKKLFLADLESCPFIYIHTVFKRNATFKLQEVLKFILRIQSYFDRVAA